MNADTGAARAGQVHTSHSNERRSTGLFHEPPRPLFRDMPKAAEFPVSALPKEIADPINAVVDRVQCPVAVAGQGVLGACSLAAQTFANVEMPTGSIRPLTEFLMTIAGSGERKTTASDLTYSGIKEYEKSRRAQFDTELEWFVDEHDAWEQARSNAKKRCKGNRAEIKAALQACGPEPKKPILPMMVTPNPTMEGLIKNAKELLPSLGIVTSEGGQFTGGHGFNDEAMLRTATAASAFWDGDSVRRIRAGDGANMVDGRRLMIDIQCQPGVALAFFGNPILADQGLISRFLSAWPESNVGTRQFRELDAESSVAIDGFRRRIFKMLDRRWPEMEGGNGGLEPRVICLSPAAKELWIKFSDRCEQQQAGNGPFATIRPFASKLAEHAARLAGTIEMVIDHDAGEVSQASMSAGIQLAAYYAAEHLRIAEAGRIGSDLQLAAKVWDWLQTSWKFMAVSLPDIYQRGPGAIREKTTADRIVRILVDHGYVAEMKKGAEIDGQRRRQAWAIYGRVP